MIFKISLQAGRSRINILLLILVIVAALFFYFSQLRHKQASPLSLPGKQIAPLIGEFLSDLEHNGTVAIGRNCRNNEVCERELVEGDLPARAWRMMANAALYQSLNDLKYRERVQADFKAMAEQWDTTSELFSLHQLATAYRFIKDEEYLRAYVKGMEFLGAHSRQRYKSPEPPLYVTVMFMLTAAQQHGAFANFLDELKQEQGNPRLRMLQKRKLLPTNQQKLDEYIQFHFNEADRILKVANKETAALSEQAEHNAAQCWLQWAKVSVYSEKQPEQLDDLPTFFEKFAATLKKGEDGFLGLQSITICAFALNQFADKSPELQEIYHNVMEQIILDAWDSQYNSKCIGNNGFNGSYGGSKTDGCTIQDISTASLIAYLLANDGYQYRIR